MSSMIRLSVEHVVLLLLVLGVMAWSWVEPVDRLTWWLEALPVVIGLPLVLLSVRAFPLSPLLNRIIALHMVFLLVGAHYTYALTPLGLWLQEVFDLSRNPYDRLGHVLQGITPALLAREVFMRLQVVKGEGWSFFLATSVALAFSAFYELMEWAAAMAYGAEAEHFLAMQGDIWDTQWDMLSALLGAVVAQVIFGGIHRRQMREFARGSHE
jgi:putative membrane protein